MSPNTILFYFHIISDGWGVAVWREWHRLRWGLVACHVPELSCLGRESFHLNSPRERKRERPEGSAWPYTLGRRGCAETTTYTHDTDHEFLHIFPSLSLPPPDSTPWVSPHDLFLFFSFSPTFLSTHQEFPFTFPFPYHSFPLHLRNTLPFSLSQTRDDGLVRREEVERALSECNV